MEGKPLGVVEVCHGLADVSNVRALCGDANEITLAHYEGLTDKALTEWLPTRPYEILNDIHTRLRRR